MGAEYPVLHYPGNVSGEDGVQEGQLLGWDEAGRPYEVIDAEYIPEVDVTNVYLQYARPENVQRQQADLVAATLRIQRMGLRRTLRTAVAR